MVSFFPFSTTEFLLFVNLLLGIPYSVPERLQFLSSRVYITWRNLNPRVIEAISEALQLGNSLREQT